MPGPLTSTDLRVIGGGAIARQDDHTPDADRNTVAIVERLRHVVSIRWNDDYDLAVGADLRPGVSDDRRIRALEFAERSLDPAPIALVMAELAWLRKVTASRGQAEGDLKVVYRLYAEALVGYPSDVVRHACHNGGHRWWPPLEELREQCERLVRTRRRIVEALRRPIAARIPEAERIAPNADDIAHVDRIVVDLVSRLRATTAARAPDKPHPEFQPTAEEMRRGRMRLRIREPACDSADGD